MPDQPTLDVSRLTDYVTQARHRAAELAELLPRAQLGGTHAADVYAVLRSLDANLESALEFVAPRPAPTPQP